MKKIFSTAVLVLALGGVCAAFGQATGSSMGSVTPSVSKKDEAHPRVFEVRERIKNQKGRVDQGLKDKTLTGEQAKACRDVIKSAEVQVKADFKTNQKEDLTEDQVRALNKILDANSSIIHEEKQESATATATPAGAVPINK